MNIRYVICCAVILVIAGYAAPVRAEQAGAFIIVDGSVEIGRAQRWVAAGVGDAVHVGDQVRTGKPGRARIAFRDRSTLNVADGSVVVIDEHVFDTDEGVFKSYLRLLQGKVRALVTEYYNDPAASYQIETATAVSGVRGTEFVVDYATGEARTQVIGLTGTVEVRGLHMRDEPGVFVTSGKYTRVAHGAAPTPVRDVGPQQMRDFLRGLQLTSAVPGVAPGHEPASAPGGGTGGVPGASPAGGEALPNDPIASGEQIPAGTDAPAPPPASSPAGDLPTGAPNRGDPFGADPKTPGDVAGQPLDELGEIGVQF